MALLIRRECVFIVLRRAVCVIRRTHRMNEVSEIYLHLIVNKNIRLLLFLFDFSRARCVSSLFYINQIKSADCSIVHGTFFYCIFIWSMLIVCLSLLLHKTLYTVSVYISANYPHWSVSECDENLHQNEIKYLASNCLFASLLICVFRLRDRSVPYIRINTIN